MRSFFALIALAAAVFFNTAAAENWGNPEVVKKRQSETHALVAGRYEEALTRRLEQAVRENGIKLTVACIATVREASDLERRTGQKITPPCIAEEKMEAERLRRQARSNAETAPVPLPVNIGISMEEAARMDMDDRCERPVAQAIAAKGVAAVIGNRDPSHVAFRYDEGRNECVLINIAKELRRPRWQDYVPPYGHSYQYGRNPYYDTRYQPATIGIEVGLDWVPAGQYGSGRKDRLIERSQGSGSYYIHR